MDFDRIKQNLRFRSGRTNMSKRFPTRELEKEQPRFPMQTQKPPATRRKARPSVNGVNPASRPKETPCPASSNLISQSNNTAEQTEHEQQNTISKEPEPKLSASESEDYDLGSAPSRAKPPSASVEELFPLLYSEGYLDTLTNEPRLLANFTSFLTTYKPSLAPLVLQYLETQKVTKAIDYANAVASSFPSENVSPAAELSASFKSSSESIFHNLLDNALPAWITYSLTRTASLCLTAEITNTSTSLTQDLVKGLSEVFCLTDPTKPDNPIIYASPEFYSLTTYPKDKVIGYNCRFLQGSKTNKESVKRLKSAIEKGEEICEALLNYTRDGRPFVNLLLLAPLRDGKGKVRYYLGAQVDCSALVEGRRGVGGFERYLLKREMRSRETEKDGKGRVLDKLRDLSAAFDLEEFAVVRSSSRRGSISEVSEVARGASKVRRRIADEESSGSGDDDFNAETGKDNKEWKLAGDEKSGRLPGLYKKYVLVRPYPSLRMIFVSQAARRLGKLQQKRFLAHVAAPAATLSGLKESLKSGIPVTAKIALMDHAGESREGTVTGKWGKRGDGPAEKGTVCWVSATPLLDTDDNVGVWMVAIIDEKTTISNRGRLPDALSKRPDGTLDIQAEIQSLDQTRDVRDDDTEQKEVDGIQTPGLEPEAVNIPSQAPQSPKTQRSGSITEKDHAIANGIPTESTNGSRMSSRAQSPSHPSTNEQNTVPNSTGNDEAPTTPPGTEFENESDLTPRQSVSRRMEGQSARDVGLRAMDYLSSRSSLQQLQPRESAGNDGEGREDLSAASPYSVD